MTERLILCTTPLQTLIASEIQRLEPANDTFLYLASSDSPKGRAYFERFVAPSKHYASFRPDGVSSVINWIIRYYRLPGWLRRRRFDRVLISSFNNLTFSLMQGRSRCPVDTFDDGTFNLDVGVFTPYVDNEPLTALIVRRVAGSQLGGEVFRKAERHFSIFDRSLALEGHGKIVELDLFKWTPAVPHRGEVTVFLGSPIRDICRAIGRMDLADEREAAYQKILKEVPHNIFLPHPAEARNAWVEPELSEFKNDVETCIAEDLALRLVRAGYALTVYGFSSTSLLTLRGVAKTINLLLPGETVPTYMQVAGLRNISVNAGTTYDQITGSAAMKRKE